MGYINENENEKNKWAKTVQSLEETREEEG